MYHLNGHPLVEVSEIEWRESNGGYAPEDPYYEDRDEEYWEDYCNYIHEPSFWTL